ncbi:uncharacterized protein LOC135487643 [Lineus longissimus]|uniref:uncharacterized protein LOC135487643 n=1 Tax=Lineus longissimus TaxID=88925 RepID=UPI002B4D3A05
MGCKSSKSTRVESMHGKQQQTQEEPCPKLTDFQLDIVSCTWPLLSRDLMRSGSKILIYVFEAAPHMKQLFSFRDVRNERLSENEIFQRHAMNFISIIEEVVDNLESLESGPIGQKLMILGAKHAMIPGFDNAYFAIFKKSVLYTWEMILSEEFTQEVNDVWEWVMDFIIDKMGEGYTYSVMDALRRQNASRASETCYSESVSDINLSGPSLTQINSDTANGKPANGHANQENQT